MYNVKPKRFVNYNRYTLFISFLAHELKRLGIDNFIKTFKNKKYYGINKKYLDGYIEYLENKKHGHSIVCNKQYNRLVVDPYVYTAYYKYGDKSVVNRALDNAIPEFLNKGLLITETQEAVNASNKHTISKERKCNN